MIAHGKGSTAVVGPHRALGPRWGQDRRLEFIEYRLRWSDRLNRSDLTTFFGISVPQASLDLAEYAQRAPQNLQYDRRTRTYSAAGSFRPIFASSGLERYLDDLLASESPGYSRSVGFLGWHPPVAITPRPGRPLQTPIVSAFVSAIQDNDALSVSYQSLSRPEPFTRTLTPHALANDGFRWHVRAYCHSRKKFLDFLFSRILKIEGKEKDRPRSHEDTEWNTVVRLVLTPHPKLARAHQRAIELDFGMKDGTCEFNCRQALLFYTLRQLGLDKNTKRSAEAQQIVLKNESQLQDYLPKTRFR
jgi:hypothetical protein